MKRYFAFFLAVQLLGIGVLFANPPVEVPNESAKPMDMKTVPAKTDSESTKKIKGNVRDERFEELLRELRALYPQEPIQK